MTQLSPEIDADIRYEVVLMGPNVQNWIGPLTSDLRDAFRDYMLDPNVFLGVSNAQQFQDDQDGDICVGVWMGSLHANQNRVDLEVLEWMLVNKIPVFPVVDNLSGFENKVPTRLHHVNGMSWNSRTLTAELMAAFKLVGNIRRAFVSYRRAESMGVAVQLFEELSKKGYEVFLDTASVLPGIPFQEALWSRMSNADLVVFLDSPQALDSQWVHQEIGRANARDYRARFVAESSAIPIAVLFDGLGMDVAWADHLQWLNGRNPIKVKSTSELEQWIEGL